MVLATTDDVPELAAALERRHRQGHDLFDEVWEGVYRIVPVPGPRHAAVQANVLGVLGPLAAGRGLLALGPVNVGSSDDYRVPDMCVVDPEQVGGDAIIATARLVVEILSPAEAPGAKSAFYAAHGVEEYLEVRLAPVVVELFAFDQLGEPILVPASQVVPELDLEAFRATITTLLDSGPAEA